jgi:hypothetical protein
MAMSLTTLRNLLRNPPFVTAATIRARPFGDKMPFDCGGGPLGPPSRFYQCISNAKTIYFRLRQVSNQRNQKWLLSDLASQQLIQRPSCIAAEARHRSRSNARCEDLAREELSTTRRSSSKADPSLRLPHGRFRPRAPERWVQDVNQVSCWRWR